MSAGSLQSILHRRFQRTAQTIASSLIRGLSVTWYVFVFANVPVLLLYPASLSTFPLDVSIALRPAAVLAAAGGLMLLALRPMISSIHARAVYASGLCLGLGTVTLTSTLADGFWLQTKPRILCLTVLHVSLGLAGGALMADPRRLPRAPRALQIAAATLIGTAGIQAVVAGTPSDSWKSSADAIIRSSMVRLPDQASGGHDVIHIILDGLGSVDVLARHYAIDLGSDVQKLERSGFRVVTDARSNYVHTYSSVASMLNAAYLDDLAILGTDADRRPLRYLIQNSSVVSSLKSGGYKFVFIGSSYSATSTHAKSDLDYCRSIGLNELESALYRYSPFRVFTLEWLTYEPFRTKIRCQFDALRDLEVSDSPRFVLAHLITPHPPFAFSAEGGPAPAPRPLFGMQDANTFPGTRSDYIADYREQVRFVLSQVQDIAHLLIRSNPNSVIIVSGDHGPGSQFFHESLHDSDLHERFGTFLAIRLPDGREPKMLPTTLANVYRFVFREALGVDMPMLRDKFVYSRLSSPYVFEVVEEAP